MEDETGFLSKEDENKTRIQDLLMKVLQDLNERQVTTIVGKKLFSSSPCNLNQFFFFFFF